jgi:hypothetical protein
MEAIGGDPGRSRHWRRFSAWEMSAQLTSDDGYLVEVALSRRDGKDCDKTTLRHPTPDGATGTSYLTCVLCSSARIKRLGANARRRDGSPSGLV